MPSNLFTNRKGVAQVGEEMSPKSFTDSVAEQGLTPRLATPGPVALLSLPLKPLVVTGPPVSVLAVSLPRSKSFLLQRLLLPQGCSYPRHKIYLVFLGGILAQGNPTGAYEWPLNGTSVLEC